MSALMKLLTTSTNASLKLLIKQANILDLQMQEGLHVCVEQEENKYGYVECQHERVREHGVHDCTHWQTILTLINAFQILL